MSHFEEKRAAVSMYMKEKGKGEKPKWSSPCVQNQKEWQQSNHRKDGEKHSGGYNKKCLFISETFRSV